ncbi:MAG: hypothetical protein ACRDH9_01095 [Actinomycetota bacterium]
MASSARPPNRFSRRQFLARAGALSFGAALAQLPGALRGKGWFDEAAAQDPDLTRDTINGLVVFIVPGPDEYSIAQGEQSTTPGGIEAGTTDNLIENLDGFLPNPDLGPFNNDGTVPLSGAVAGLLNQVAAEVDPLAAGGPFPSHFSRLSFADKAEVFKRIEAMSGDDDATRNIRFVGGILPGYTAYLVFGEWHVLDPINKTLSGRPVGWDLTGYQPGLTTQVRGWDELKGYFEGRKQARTGRKKKKKKRKKRDA